MGKNSKRKRDKRKTSKKAPGVLAKNTPNTHRTLALAMIMKNEVDDLHRIVNDYGKYLDKIYVTVTHKDTYDELTKESLDSNVELSYFKWIDHFGKARRYNQKQIKTDYWMWIDLDDEIEGAEKLHQVVEYMDANDLDAVWLQYDYIRRTNLSEPGAIHWKVRIVRSASKLGWNDEAIHENIHVQSDTRYIRLSESDVMVKHRKTADQLHASGDRNRVILEKDWQRNHREITAHYQGRDFMMIGNYKDAIEKFTYVTEHAINKALKFDAWHNLCECYFQTENYDAALIATNEAVAIEPDHPTPWYQRFAVYMRKGDHYAALQSAEAAMTKRVKDDDIGILLAQDPSFFQYVGPFNVARAYLSVGNAERAYQLYLEVKKIAPQYIDEMSAATGTQWSAVFEQAYNEFKKKSTII